MATDATGTPTTNFSIPKLDTANDAPSGLGFNAAMDSIDTTLKTQIDAVNVTVAGKPGLAMIIALGG